MGRWRLALLSMAAALAAAQLEARIALPLSPRQVLIIGADIRVWRFRT
jgi:hypothetical protein